jgi:hypothetical protein
MLLLLQCDGFELNEDLRGCVFGWFWGLISLEMLANSVEYVNPISANDKGI